MGLCREDKQRRGFLIYESEIKPILLDVFSATRVDTEAMLRSYTEMFRSMENDDETAIKIEELKKTIALAGQKKNKLLELVTFGTVTAANFKSMTDSCDREIDEANAEIAELEKLVFTKDEYRRHMSEVRTRLDAAVRDAADGLITNEFVAQYIDKIMVTITDDDTANLKIRIFTGKSTERWLSNLAERSQSRAGHTFKKMIEKYENDIKASK